MLLFRYQIKEAVVTTKQTQRGKIAIITDFLCCFELHVLNSKFDTENITCVIESKEFEMLCMSEVVLKN